MTILGVDYSFDRPSPEAIKAAGASFVVRYLAPTHESGKVISGAEVAALHAAGLNILLVWEDTATNALGGAAKGQADGISARIQADALGYPTQCPIYAAVDFQPSTAQMPTVVAYLTAFAQAIAPYAFSSIGYGNVAVINATGGWQTSAWSGGQISPRATLYQRQKATVTWPAGCDEDVMLAPINTWGPNPIPVVPASGGNVVAAPTAPIIGVVKNRSGAGFWVGFADGSIWSMFGAPFYGAFGSYPNPSGVPATFDAIGECDGGYVLIHHEPDSGGGGFYQFTEASAKEIGLL